MAQGRNPKRREPDSTSDENLAISDGILFLNRKDKAKEPPSVILALCSPMKENPENEDLSKKKVRDTKKKVRATSLQNTEFVSKREHKVHASTFLGIQSQKFPSDGIPGWKNKRSRKNKGGRCHNSSNTEEKLLESGGVCCPDVTKTKQLQKDNSCVELLESQSMTSEKNQAMPFGDSLTAAKSKGLSHNTTNGPEKVGDLSTVVGVTPQGRYDIKYKRKRRRIDLEKTKHEGINHSLMDYVIVDCRTTAPTSVKTKKGLKSKNVNDKVQKAVLESGVSEKPNSEVSSKVSSLSKLKRPKKARHHTSSLEDATVACSDGKLVLGKSTHEDNAIEDVSNSSLFYDQLMKENDSEAKKVQTIAEEHGAPNETFTIGLRTDVKNGKTSCLLSTGDFLGCTETLELGNRQGNLSSGLCRNVCSTSSPTVENFSIEKPSDQCSRKRSGSKKRKKVKTCIHEGVSLDDTSGCDPYAKLPEHVNLKNSFCEGISEVKACCIPGGYDDRASSSRYKQEEMVVSPSGDDVTRDGTVNENNCSEHLSKDSAPSIPGKGASLGKQSRFSGEKWMPSDNQDKASDNICNLKKLPHLESHDTDHLKKLQHLEMRDSSYENVVERFNFGGESSEVDASSIAGKEKSISECHLEGRVSSMDTVDDDALLVVHPLIGTRRKNLLVLDLNGLLADIVTFVPNGYRPDTRISQKALFKRPFCDEFLRFCFERFDVGVWSSRTKKNVDSVVKYLMPYEMRDKLLFCWDQSDCTETGFTTVENSEKPLVLKELKKLWNKDKHDLPWEKGQFNESNTLLLDDSPYKALKNPPFTAVFPESYTFCARDDTSLGPGGDLRVYLEEVAMTTNVQKYVEEHPFGQRAITDKNPSWAYYRKVITGTRSYSTTRYQRW